MSRKQDPLDKKRLYELVNELYETIFYKKFLHNVKFNHRLRTTGGRYLPNTKTIELNPKYLIELGMEEFIGIIKHELCHYHLHIEGKPFGEKDSEFQQLLTLTNSPKYCNPLPSEKKKQYIFQCISCLTDYKRKIKLNVNRYRCSLCGGRIRLREKNNSTHP